MLSDFSFTPPDQILAQLQSRQTDGTHGMDMHGTEMHGTPMSAIKSERDLNDVQYDAFLANSRTLADPGVVSVEPGVTGVVYGSPYVEDWALPKKSLKRSGPACTTPLQRPWRRRSVLHQSHTSHSLTHRVRLRRSFDEMADLPSQAWRRPLC